ncbi:hypothetical protein AQJ11_15475 [Streptomyces corchorusii]|uniref:Uncharacterized protein n=1 Tax=Streptomyces corchorusii TaxID=1903 RepID=A0A101QDU7_STRCK|nr:hypothetical protein AQJ11_15475 [Streptomyces corchorusii]
MRARWYAPSPSARSTRSRHTFVSMTSPRTPRRLSAVANSSPNTPSVEGEVVVTTRRSPPRHCSTAAWIMRLSPGQDGTVTAVPATRTPCWTGRRRLGSSPVRPIASCTVATPYPARASTSSAAALGGLVTITPLMPAPS